MKLHSLIIDHLNGPFYPLVRKTIFALPFADQVYPGDGEVYEQVCANLPIEIQEGFKRAIENIMQEKIDVKLMVARRSDETRKVRALPHHDEPVAAFNAILYFNDFGGTVTLAHKKTGLWKAPINAKEQLVFEEGRLHPEDWNVVTVCPGKQDRLFIVNSSLIHQMVLPENSIGYGTGDNARMVLVAFFTVIPKVPAPVVPLAPVKKSRKPMSQATKDKIKAGNIKHWADKRKAK